MLKLKSEFLSNCGRGGNSIDCAHGKTNRVLGRSLGNENDVDAARRKRAKEPLGDPGNTNHAQSAKGQQCHSYNRSDSFDQLFTFATPPRYDSARFVRPKRVLDQDRNPAGNSRRDCRGVKHLGAEIGEFHRFFVRNIWQNERGRYIARIGAENPIDIGPDFDGRGLERATQNCSRIIRSVSAQRCRLSVESSRNKPCHHRDWGATMQPK